MVRRVSKTQEETEMARRGENIHKRKDGRWEGRYIKARTPEGKSSGATSMAWSMLRSNVC